MPGFFDTYVEPEQDQIGGDGAFLSGDDKAALIKSGASFVITNVTFDPENKYGARYVLDIELDGEERRAGFQIGSGVRTRDDMLQQMAAYFGVEGAEPVKVKLTGAGQATLITAA